MQCLSLNSFENQDTLLHSEKINIIVNQESTSADDGFKMTIVYKIHDTSHSIRGTISRHEVIPVQCCCSLKWIGFMRQFFTRMVVI